ncbi:MAG TPA: hypothetical protein VGD53_20170 [Actinoallomurus sp.]
MSHLVLSVPETVTSHYVIATSDPLDDPRAVVPWRVPEPFRAAAVEALATPRLGIFTIAADEATWRLDDLLASEDDRRRVRESSHQVLVVHRAPTVDQPRGEQMARAVARAIADASDGVLIDPQARQVVLRDGLARVERGWFRMGDQWFGTRYDVNDAAGRPAHDVDFRGTESCSCLRITLLGLRRFGLPDLMIENIACAHELPALSLLRSLACRLLTDQWQWARLHPRQPTRPLDDHPKIDPDDFWTFWGATPFVDGRPITLRLVPISRTTLKVMPPEGYPGTQAVWGREVLVPAMPPLVGCPADEDSPWPRPAENEA